MTTLIVKSVLDKKPYRLKCRFKIEPHPSHERVEREKVQVAEMFVEDMRKQGWEHMERYGFRMTGPFPYVAPVTIHVPPTPTAREMRPYVAEGHRFRDLGGTTAALVPTLDMTEWWEFELSAIFVRPAILTEYPDAHEVDNG